VPACRKAEACLNTPGVTTGRAARHLLSPSGAGNIGPGRAIAPARFTSHSSYRRAIISASMSDYRTELPPAVVHRLDEAFDLLVQQAYSLLSWPGGFYGELGVRIPAQNSILEPARGTFSGTNRTPRR
jgi:hypothetical protein